ncbi:MAG: hydrogenase formation protein HypD [bacterium]|nr:hydrogenase formation protein HypD [bacterium]
MSASEDAFRDPARVEALRRRLHEQADELGREVVVMEACGTHTHAIAEAGLRRLLPPSIRLISGPGCPVCVTPVDYLDRAVALARRPDITITTFGDLIRVPATDTSLERERAAGCDVRDVYSARDALAIARNNPTRRVVFLGVGFETTMPTIAAALEEAEHDDVDNFMVLAGGKLIGPPLRALLADGEVRVDAFLLPGHVSVILGSKFYDFLVDEYQVPAAIAGFAPVDVLAGVSELVTQLAGGRARIANLYPRVVNSEGNEHAQALMARLFEPVDTRWRGLGEIPLSGLGMRARFAHRDAWRIPVVVLPSREPRGCRCGEVLKGSIEPPECPLFDKVCVPDDPKGACMVSSEGTCAAWYRHERFAMGVRA